MVLGILYSISFIFGLIFGALAITIMRKSNQECFGCIFFIIGLTLGETIILLGLLTTDFELFLEADIDTYLNGGMWILFGFILGIIAYAGKDQTKCPAFVIIFLSVSLVLVNLTIPEIVANLVLLPTLSSLSGLEFYSLVVFFMLTIIGFSGYFFIRYRITSIAVMVFSLQMIALILVGFLSNVWSFLFAVIAVLSITRFIGVLQKRGFENISNETRWQALTLTGFTGSVAIFLAFIPSELMNSIVSSIQSPTSEILLTFFSLLLILLTVWGLGIVSFEKRIAQRQFRKAEKEAIEYYKHQRSEISQGSRVRKTKDEISRIHEHFDENMAREYVRSLLWRTQRELPLLDSMQGNPDLYQATLERLKEDIIEANQIIESFGLSDLISSLDDTKMKLDTRG